jgi:hypothetical protein
VLLPPHAVRPYVLRNKTDDADAKGLLEAVHPVPVKSVDPHVLAARRSPAASPELGLLAPAVATLVEDGARLEVPNTARLNVDALLARVEVELRAMLPLPM